MSLQDIAQLNYLENGQISDTLTNTSNVKNTKSLLVAQKPDLSYTNLTTDLNSKLLVSPTQYHNEIALGNVPNTTNINLFGYNTDVDTAAPEVLGAGGGAFTPLLTASTLTIVSSSALDVGAGTGGRTLYLKGVNATNTVQTQTVTLTGATPIVTVTTWLGINEAIILTSGSTLSNAGNINITATTGGAIQAYIPIGTGRSQQIIYHTPLGHKSLGHWLVLNTEKFPSGNPVCIFKGWYFDRDANTKYEIFRAALDANVTSYIQLNPPTPYVLTEKSCFWMEVQTDVNDTIVTGRISLTDYTL